MTSLPIDRLAPARRPVGQPMGHQLWRDLLFLHWPLKAEELRRLVPPALSIDLYQGEAYLGIVPFAILGSRWRCLPLLPLGRDFLETNLRTYVHAGGHDPGVYFFSLDAASRLAVAGARLVFALPYYWASMGLAPKGPAREYWMERRSGSRPRLRVRYQLGETLGPSSPGTLEHFLLERYLLHVQRGKTLWTTQVHHSPYPARTARVLDLEEDLSAAVGLRRPPGLPPLAHYVAGVDVEIFPPRKTGVATSFLPPPPI